MFRELLAASFGLAIVSIAGTAQAAEIFTDRAAWEAALADFSTETFSGQEINDEVLFYSTGIMSIQPGNAANFVNASLEYNGVTRGPTASGPTSTTWQFPAEIMAFGADFRSLDSDGLTVIGDFDGDGEQTISVAQTIDGGASGSCTQCISGFFGIIGDTAFDSFVMDSDNSDETFQLDDLSFSEVPVLECVGFASPFDVVLAITKDIKRVIPVKMELFDEHGIELDDTDLLKRPVIDVTFRGGSGDGGISDNQSLLSAKHATIRNEFQYSSSQGLWVYRLDTKLFRAPGNYSVTAISGDPGSLRIDNQNGACTSVFKKPEK